MKFFCFCNSNCKYETMTKEQILTAIAQAAETGLVIDPDAGFITKVKEGNAGGYVTFWVGTTAQYNALTEIDPNCIYIKTDDTRDADMIKAIADAAAAADEAAEQAADAMSLAEKNKAKFGGIDGYMYSRSEFAFAGLNSVLNQTMARALANSSHMQTVECVFTDEVPQLGMGGVRAMVTVFCETEGYGYALLRFYNYNTGVLNARMKCYNGTWSEIMWENPPMESGVEYCTTEIWNGKAVYAKLVNFGALPNNTTKSVAIGVPYTNVIDVNQIYYNADVSASYHYETDATIAYYYNSINITTTTDKSNTNAMILVRYIKN